MVIELSNDSATLVLQVNDEWCTAIFDQGRRHILGSDRPAIIIESLLRALRREPNGNPTGLIGGVAVQHVASLFEEHGTIFVGYDCGVVRLYLQGASGDLLGTIELAETQRLKWIDLLESNREALRG